jgi:hypothetical protein
VFTDEELPHRRETGVELHLAAQLGASKPSLRRVAKARIAATPNLGDACEALAFADQTRPEETDLPSARSGRRPVCASRLGESLKISKVPTYFAVLALLASAPIARGETFLFTKTTIAPNPPATGAGMSLEKAIDYFTSTSYPSFFLGSQHGAFIYDAEKRSRISIASEGYHYEKAKPFLYPGDKYPGIIASVDNTLVWYQNPANWNGGDATKPWPKYAISSESGCHDLEIADLDSDGKQDVACSGTALYHESSVLLFQNAHNSWTPSQVNAAPAGEGIALVAISGVNGGARTNIVGCSNDKLYWYQNPGGAAARTTAWTPHYIGPCNDGVSIASVDVGDRDLVVVASNEELPTAWAPGLVYFDPGANPYDTWTERSIDSSYRDVHQITSGTLDGVVYITVGEQEQASNSCNTRSYNNHPDVTGCRVAIFPWTGTGFGAPTIVSHMGTQNQQVLQIGNVAWMVGANHNAFRALDPAYYLWRFQRKVSSQRGAGFRNPRDYLRPVRSILPGTSEQLLDRTDLL